METSKVNLISFYLPLLDGLSDEQEKDFSLEGQINSAA
jgi:hypothetical protein